MAVTVDKVIVSLEAKVAKYNADVRGAEKQFDRSMSNIKKSGAQTEQVFTRMGSSLKQMFAGVAVGAIAAKLIQLADTAKTLDAQLKLATATYGDFGQAQEDVRRISTETRSELEATSKLYGNFMRNARELGITQEQAARATESVAKAFTISGAGAVESAQGTRQLVQALQSGVLRGDEFNTIMETAPRLARLLADSLGVTTGSLRALAEEGSLTSDKLTAALTDKRFTAALDAEFKELPVTFSQAMTLVENAAIQTFGEFDRGGQFSTMLANFVTDGAAGFDSLGEAAFELGIDIRSTLAGLADAFQPMLDGAMSAFGIISSETKSLSAQISNLLGEVDAITAHLAKGEGPVENWINQKLWGKNVGGTNFQRNFNKGQEASARQARREAGEAQFKTSSIYRRYDVMGNPISGGPPLKSIPRKGKGAGGGKKKAAASSPLNPEAFAREEAALNDEILRLKQDTITDASERSRLEIERLNAARAATIAEVNGDKRYTSDQKAKILALTDVVHSLEVAKVASERYADAITKAAEAQENNQRYELEAARAVADMAPTREARLEAERRILDLLEKQEKAELEALIAANKIADANGARADQATAQAARRQSMERSNEGPGASYLRQLTEGAESLDDTLDRIAVDGLEAMNDGIAKAVEQTFKLHGALGQIINDFIQIAIRQTLIKPLAESLFGGGGGGGGLFGILKGVSGIAGMVGGGGGSGPFGGMSLTGMASGGNAVAGIPHIVGESGEEVFIPSQSGTIIPNGRLTPGGSSSQPAAVRVEVVGGEMFDARVTRVAGDVSVEVVRAAAPAIVDASAAATARQMSRPKM